MNEETKKKNVNSADAQRIRIAAVWQELEEAMQEAWIAAKAAKVAKAAREAKEREALLAWAKQSARNLFDGFKDSLVSLDVVREEWKAWARQNLGCAEAGDPRKGWPERLEETELGRAELDEYRRAKKELAEKSFELENPKFFQLMESIAVTDNPGRMFAFDAVDGSGLRVECGRFF